jgi:hypothetical protein
MPTVQKRPRTSEETSASSFHKRPLSCILAVATVSPLVLNHRPSSVATSIKPMVHRSLSIQTESDEASEPSSVYEDASESLSIEAEAGLSSPESLLVSPHPRCVCFSPFGSRAFRARASLDTLDARTDVDSAGRRGIPLADCQSPRRTLFSLASTSTRSFRHTATLTSSIFPRPRMILRLPNPLKPRLPLLPTWISPGLPVASHPLGLYDQPRQHRQPQATIYRISDTSLHPTHTLSSH